MFFPHFYPTVPKVLLHIGASFGDEAHAYVAAGIQHVIWVEADPDIFQHLIRNVADYGHTCINAVATDRDGDVVTFRVTSNHSRSSSIFPMQDHIRLFPTVTVSRSVRLVTSRLDTLLYRLGFRISDIDGVVIDVQGAELLALKGLGIYLRGLDVIITEFSRVPLYTGGVSYEELNDFLVANGFAFVKSSVGPDGAVGDAVYRRTNDASVVGRPQRLTTTSNDIAAIGPNLWQSRHRAPIRRIGARRGQVD